jgi:DsbC/DsbD-like thiol-disulfide interchange protein
MARPGYFFLDTRGVIREKFFEAKYRQRVSASSVLAKLFPELGQEVTNTIEAPHLQLLVEQSDRTAFPGGRITLTAEVRLPPGVHVYAPEVKGYKPVNLLIDPMAQVQLKPAAYPRSKILYLEAIKERVPVFEGTFRIRQDLHVATAADFSNSLGADGKTITIAGKLEYQACDRKICYRPTSVPIQWRLQVMPLDRQRAPEDIRHK